MRQELSSVCSSFLSGHLHFTCQCCPWLRQPSALTDCSDCLLCLCFWFVGGDDTVQELAHCVNGQRFLLLPDFGGSSALDDCIRCSYMSLLFPISRLVGQLPVSAVLHGELLQFSDLSRRDCLGLPFILFATSPNLLSQIPNDCICISFIKIGVDPNICETCSDLIKIYLIWSTTTYKI